MEKEKKHIFCDGCRKTIEIDVKEQIVGADKHGDVTEQYFECPYCGKHYTITVYNRPMKFKIMRRKQLRQKINNRWGHATEMQFRSMLAEDTRLKNELLREANELKRKYIKEGET